jgi:hypothetical protein
VVVKTFKKIPTVYVVGVIVICFNFKLMFYPQTKCGKPCIQLKHSNILLRAFIV